MYRERSQTVSEMSCFFFSDVNECLTNNGGCDSNAACSNTDGGSTCTCNSGYTGDGTSCTGDNPVIQHLYIRHDDLITFYSYRLRFSS